MFFTAVRPKRDATYRVAPATVHLPVRLGHRDARAVFAEPLARRMAVAAQGDLLGCETREAAPGDITSVTLHLGVRDPSRAGLLAVARHLDGLAAPCGSSIRLADLGVPLVFGLSEGLEISVDASSAGTAGGRRDVARRCAEALDGAAAFRGWVSREGRTVFYFYGSNFAKMQELLARGLKGVAATSRRMA